MEEFEPITAAIKPYMDRHAKGKKSWAFWSAAASLSKAYATHAASHVGDAKYSGFVGLGSSADHSIFNKIDQPQFVGMLSEKQKVALKIDWYAGACNPENPGQPDYRFKAGSIDGVYAKGDRAAMVDKAETENKRRIDLFKEKGINGGAMPMTTGGTITDPRDTTLDGTRKGSSK